MRQGDLGSSGSSARSVRTSRRSNPMLHPPRFQCDECKTIAIATVKQWNAIELPEGWIAWCPEKPGDSIHNCKHFCNICRIPCECEEHSMLQDFLVDPGSRCLCLSFDRAVGCSTGSEYGARPRSVSSKAKEVTNVRTSFEGIPGETQRRGIST